MVSSRTVLISGTSTGISKAPGCQAPFSGWLTVPGASVSVSNLVITFP